MWIDAIFLGFFVVAVIKGASRGIIMALFSFVGWFVGLLAAIKFSAVIARFMLHHTTIGARWLPVLSFVLAFVIAVWLVRAAGKIMEKVVNLASLGLINRVGGALLYTGMYILSCSVLLFYAGKMNLLDPGSLSASYVYSLTKDWIPNIVEALGNFIPVLKNVFRDLQDFFNENSKIPVAP